MIISKNNKIIDFRYKKLFNLRIKGNVTIYKYSRKPYINYITF